MTNRARSHTTATRREPTPSTSAPFRSAPGGPKAPHTGPGTILLDFDGVISPNSVELTIDLLFAFLSRHHPITRKHVEDVVRLAMPFPVRGTLEYLFHGLGLSHRLTEFLDHFEAFERSGRIRIHPEFAWFHDWAERQGLQIHIVSTGSSQRLSALPPGSRKLVNLKGRSKADPATFRDLCTDLSCSPVRTLVVDDCPLVLAAAHRAGLGTVLMSTPLFSAAHWRPCAQAIDVRLTSWRSLSRTCRDFFR